MKPTRWFALTCLALAITPCPGNTLLFGDNFNTGLDGPIDDSDPSRLIGTAGGETTLQSHGALQFLAADRLDLAAAGGVRFGPELMRFDWAGAITGDDIIAAGGFVVSFDWTHSGSSSEWLAWKIGTANGDTSVNGASVDHALLIRQGPTATGETNERWDNGTNLGDSGISYNPVAGTTTTYPVKLTYRFDDFADGSSVILSAVVNGIEIVNDTFTWDGNGGALHMEMQSGIDGNFVDNLRVETIPVLDVTVDAATFASGAPQGRTIGTLSATPPGGEPEPATFTLVAGAGAIDNALFQLNGDTLEVGDFDFREEPPGSSYSIRVRAEGQTSGTADESILQLTLVEDDDDDLLPDEWELYWAFGSLDELDGRATSPGPGALTGDFDGDGLTDLEEYELSLTYPNLSPYDADSDFDGLEDGEEVAGAGSRPPTDPTLPDTDADGLFDDQETNTGTFVDGNDTGTNPTLWDTDGDGVRDDFEISANGDPLDPDVQPPTPDGLSFVLLSDDASTGISTAKTYTHAISGGAATTLNGVAFAPLTAGETPANLIWDLATAGGAGVIVDNLGEWDPEAGGVTGEGLVSLLSSFTFPTGKTPSGYQDFVLTGLVPGQQYELSLFMRTWDLDGPGRPIDLHFINGQDTRQLTGPILVDRPDISFPDASVHAACVIRYRYTADAGEVTLRAQIPSTEDPTVEGTGGLHLYGLANAVEGAVPQNPLRMISVSRGASDELTLQFAGNPATLYQVTRSADLVAPFQPFDPPLEVTTDGSGIGTAVVPAGALTGPRGFFRIEEP